METFYIRGQLIGAGITVNDNRDINVDNSINGSDTIPAGATGVAGAEGSIDLLAGHGITAGDFVCVSGVFGENYNAEVLTAGATGISVVAGDGDALPASGSVIVSKQSEIDLGVLGTNAALLSISGDVPLLTTLETSDSVALAKTTIAGGAYRWDSGCGEANPVTGDSIVKAHVYNLGTVAGAVRIMVGYDND